MCLGVFLRGARKLMLTDPTKLPDPVRCKPNCTTKLIDFLDTSLPNIDRTTLTVPQRANLRAYIRKIKKDMADGIVPKGY